MGIRESLGSTHPIDRSDKSDRQSHEEGVLTVATIWKRKDRDVWVADYREATGKLIRLTAGRRPEAEGLLADKVKETREAHLRMVDLRKMTLKDYVVRWSERVISFVSFRSVAHT